MEKEEKIGQLLVQEGLLKQEQLQEILEKQKGMYSGTPLGELLIQQGLIKESDFLRVLAKQFRTQYVTTQKLAELTIPSAILRLIPLAIAEKYFLLPIQYSKKDKSLAIVTIDPLNVNAIDEVKFASGISNIKALVAIKAAIKAGIEKFYKGNDRAFDFAITVEGETQGAEIETTGSSMFMPGSGFRDEIVLEPDTGEKEEPAKKDEPLEIAGMGEMFARTEARPSKAVTPPREPTPPPRQRDDGIFLGGLDHFPGDDNLQRDKLASAKRADVIDFSAEVEESAKTTVKEKVKEIKKYHRKLIVVEPHDQIRKFIVKLLSREGYQVEGVPNREAVFALAEREDFDAVVIKERNIGEGSEFEEKLQEVKPNIEVHVIKDYGGAMIGETRLYSKVFDGFFETLDVIIGLMEVDRESFQGHTHLVAKYAKLIAQKLNLSKRELDEVRMSAYAHDLGKKGLRHYTLLDTLSPDVDFENIQDTIEIPIKLLAPAKLPIDIAKVVGSSFERYDGRGFPKGLKGEEIPIASRILSLVDSFAHLQSEGWKGRVFGPADAMGVIKEYSGVLFDPKLVETLIQVVKDDMFVGKMDAAREHILIADEEADLTTLLELKFANAGYRVTIARNGEEAFSKAESAPPDLLIADVDLPKLNGFSLVEKFKKTDKLADIPFIFLSRRDDSKLITKAFDLGAEDIVQKPVRVEVLFAKIQKMMERIARSKKAAAPAGTTAGVSGSLSEMSLPDIVQILGAGRRTCLLTIHHDSEKADIYLEEGRIVNTVYKDMKGEEAFYSIIGWEEGTFTITPDVQITERLINKSNDSLMLEGFRRLDEGSKEASPDDISLDGSDFF